MQIDRSQFLSLCISMFSATAVACGGGGERSDSAGADLFGIGGSSSGDSASAVHVNAKKIAVTGDGCSAQGTVPVVSIPGDKAAEDAINGVLATLGSSSCDDGADTTVSFAVTANANGLLSIRVTRSARQKAGGDSMAAVSTYDFDVKHGGAKLELADVATADGIAKEKAQCFATEPALGSPAGESLGVSAPSVEGGTLGELPSPVTESFGTDSSSTCARAADKTEPSWLAKPEGLEIEVATDHAHGDVRGSIVPWKDLVASGLKSSVVLDFAKAQK
jgi:hypothetical protein